MDANGTRYHLVLGRDDWQSALPDPPGDARYDGKREDLALATRPFLAPRRVGDRRPRPSDRRGVGSDAHGSVYWIGDDRRVIRVQSAGSGAISQFWAPGPATQPTRNPGAFAVAPGAAPGPPCPEALWGLSVTEDHLLVAGTREPDGLLVFDLVSPGPPRQALWPIPLTPVDLCPRPGGGVFVLDAQRRIWELDRRLLVVTRRTRHHDPAPADFGPVEPVTDPLPEPDWRAHRRVDAADGTAIPGDPIAIDLGPGGTVVVLGDDPDGPSSLRLYHPERRVTGDAVPLILPAAGDGGEPEDVVAHDLATLGDIAFVADGYGNQAFTFALTDTGDGLVIDRIDDHHPMRLFGGKGLVRCRKRVLYDFGDAWVPLTAQARSQHVRRAEVYVGGLDAHEPGVVWHRLMVDACIPPGASIFVQTRAADERDELDAAPWQDEPPLAYRRSAGSELPFAPATGYDTWELLFQRARGRHLGICLRLAGDGRVTPRIRALRAYYPRFSYAERYLPKLYREEPVSASFLDRYLANLEGLLTGLEDRMAAAHALADPRTTTPEAIDWLMGWFEFTADPAWGEQRRRLFLRHAMEFFALRGTVPGIRLALRLALDECDGEHLFDLAAPDRTSRVVERFRTRRTPPAVLGDPLADGPALVARQTVWEPGQGRQALIDRWPGEEELRAFSGDPAWAAFIARTLAIEPPREFDPGVWTQFLEQRYRAIGNLDDAYGLAGTARHRRFADVALPKHLPADGAPLRDWHQFLTIVLPSRRSAHRFTVLLPVPAEGEGRTAEQRRAIAQRVVELQKPAHTTFDVKFFWAAFRIGEARLGEDTLLDLGSRDPRLRPPLVLGSEHAGETHLGARQETR